MILYHASNVPVENPDTTHSRKNIDFGQGFYLTSMKDQAVKYANRFKRREEDAYLSTFELPEELLEWKVKVFESYNDEWLDFILANRNGDETEYFDLIIGGIANDKVIDTLDLYVQGIYSREKTLGMLIYEKPNIQYCIRSDKMLKECLKFIKYEKI